jgi:hypothetical protein
LAGKLHGKNSFKSQNGNRREMCLQMGSGRKLALILVVDSFNGDLVGWVMSGLNGATWCHGH